jgi:hypothetical protein
MIHRMATLMKPIHLMIVGADWIENFPQTHTYTDSLTEPLASLIMTENLLSQFSII